MLAPILALSLLLTACFGSDTDEASDAGPTSDGNPGSDGAQNCQPALADPDWLSSSQESDLRRLTGIDPLPGGATLLNRATVSNRAATRGFLQARLAEHGYSSLLDEYGTGTNVFAELEATTPTTDTIVIGAHFDSVANSPGANDNATGVAMVLAAARYATTLPCRTQNMIFVFFDEEELGLIGSNAFAQLLSNPDFGARISAVHTIDQNGWDEDGDRAFELERPDTGLANLYLTAKQLAGATMPIHQTTTGSTDHVSFRAEGFAAIGVTEEYVNGDTTPHYHLPSDSYATVNRDYLASTTKIFMTMLGTSLAQASSSSRLLAERSTLGERYKAATRSPRSPPPLRGMGCRSASRSHSESAF